MVHIKDKSITELIALIIAIVFMGSLLNAFGFSHALHVNLGYLPFSKSDILNAYLSWVLPTIIALLIAQGFGYIVSFFDKNVPEEKLHLSSSLRWVRRAPYYIFFLLSSLGIVLFIVSFFVDTLQENKSWLYCYWISMLMLITIYCANRLGVKKERFTDSLSSPLCIFLFFIATAFFYGFIDGKFTGGKNLTALIKQSKKSINVVKVIDKGVLGYLPNDANKIEFYLWDNVEKLSIRKNNYKIDNDQKG